MREEREGEEREGEGRGGGKRGRGGEREGGGEKIGITFSPSNHSGIPSGTSPYNLTTPPSITSQSVAAQSADITTSSSIDQARDWLIRNRFSQYLGLFANYSGIDLLRLSRRDLVDLCGTADGIRLYNALRTHTVRVLYITYGHEKGLYLE